jgi:hypothetical protein
MVATPFVFPEIPRPAGKCGLSGPGLLDLVKLADAPKAGSIGRPPDR